MPCQMAELYVASNRMKLLALPKSQDLGHNPKKGGYEISTCLSKICTVSSAGIALASSRPLANSAGGAYIVLKV